MTIFITFTLYCIINSIYGYTKINGVWSDDFEYDASGISGWTDSRQESGLNQYHGDYRTDFDILDRYFQCAYDSIVYISFSISFDCQCQSPDDYVSFNVNDIFQTQYDNNEPTTEYRDIGGNQCSQMWHRFNSPTFNISNITLNHVFKIGFEVHVTSGNAQILIWNIDIECYFISPSPTSNPTMFPSANPTSSPTQNPSKYPTYNPSKNPTKIPTSNPTNIPTSNPTYNPSKTPTKIPTHNPTPAQTHNPTPAPTERPTLIVIAPTYPVDSRENVDVETTSITSNVTQQLEQSTNNHDSTHITIIGIGAACIVLVICLCFMCWNRYRKKKKNVEIGDHYVKMEMHDIYESNVTPTTKGDLDIVDDNVTPNGNELNRIDNKENTRDSIILLSNKTKKLLVNENVVDELNKHYDNSITEGKPNNML